MNSLLTSRSSFSCGNLFPSVLADAGNENYKKATKGATVKVKVK